MFLWLRSIAIRSGVMPRLFALSTSAPNATKYSTTAKWPFCEATKSDVSSSSLPLLM